MIDETQRRFLRHVRELPSGCWLWTGARQDCNKWHKSQFSNRAPNWRGKFRMGSTRTSRVEFAHRAAWILWRGEIGGNVVMHLDCETTLCVNPWHLCLGSAQDNAIDREERKRYMVQRESRKSVLFLIAPEGQPR